MKPLNHICNQICLFFCNICVEKLSGRTDTKTQNTSKLNDDRWNWPNLNDRIKVFRVYFDVKLAETIQCNQKSLFTQMNFHFFCPVRHCYGGCMGSYRSRGQSHEQPSESFEHFPAAPGLRVSDSLYSIFIKVFVSIYQHLSKYLSVFVKVFVSICQSICQYSSKYLSVFV